MIYRDEMGASSWMGVPSEASYASVGRPSYAEASEGILRSGKTGRRMKLYNRNRRRSA
jgi:hypothetical protein